MGKVEKSPYDLLQESLNGAIGYIQENHREIEKIQKDIGIEEEKKEEGKDSKKKTVASRLDSAINQLTQLSKQTELLQAARLKTEIESMCFYFKKGSETEFETLALRQDEIDAKIKRIADCLGELNQIALRIGENAHFQLVIEGHTNKHFRCFCCCKTNAQDRSENRASEVLHRISKMFLPIGRTCVTQVSIGRSYFYRIHRSNSPLNARVTFTVNSFFLPQLAPKNTQSQDETRNSNFHRGKNAPLLTPIKGSNDVEGDLALSPGGSVFQRISHRRN